MNKIYKIIWNRCLQRFIVTSETARGASRGRSTSSGKSIKMRPSTDSPSAINILAVCIALAFATTPSAWAQSEAKPGSSVYEINRGDPALINATVTNEAYGNALKISGNEGSIQITGGEFRVEPSPQPGDRDGDLAPYAAIWLSDSNSPNNEHTWITGSAILEVSGENLHGIYAEEDSGSVVLRGSTISAAGAEVSGATTKGRSLDIGNSTIKAEGDNALGVNSLGSSHLSIQNENTISTIGSRAIGIYTDSGNLFLSDTTVHAEGDNATGVIIRSNEPYLISNRTSLSGLDLQVNTDAAAPHSGGAGIEATGLAGLVLEDSTINVGTNEALSSVGLHLDRGIDSRKAAAHLKDIALTVKGGTNQGIYSRSFHLTLEDNITINVNGARSTGIGLFGSTADINGTAIEMTGRNSFGLEAGGESTATLTDSSIRMVGQNQTGIYAYGEDVYAEMHQGDIHISGGSGGRGAQARDSAKLEFIEGEINVISQGGYGLEANNGEITAEKTVIKVQSPTVGVVRGGSVGGTEGKTSLTGTTIEVVSSSAGAGAGATGLVVFDRAELNDKNSTITVTGQAQADGVLLSGGAQAHLTGTKLTVQAGQNGAGVAAFDEAQFTLEDVTLRVGGTEGYSALGVFSDSGSVGEILDSTIVVKSTEEAAGIVVWDGSELRVEGTTITVTDAEELVIGAHINNAKLTLHDSIIIATGNNADAIELSGFEGTSSLETAGQTTLQSSGRGVLATAEKGGDAIIDASFTNTHFVTGAETLASKWEEDSQGTQTFTLGSGVVATENNGKLLVVTRSSSPDLTGRVELNLRDGAQVSGAILDDNSDLSLLSADGGTHLAVDNAHYMGNVQNIRSLSVLNSAHVAGGLTSPNTVLEDVTIEAAELAGNWKIGGVLHARNGARVAPGNSIGVITTNAINWGAGTVYDVEVNAAGNSDRIDVTGAAPADISQAALEVRQENGNGGVRLKHDYLILTAAGGVDGVFTRADWVDNGLIKVNPTYLDNEVLISLSVDQKALDTNDFTPNQRATAKGASSVSGLNKSADAAFLSRNPAAAMDMLSGEIHPSTRAGLMQSSALMSYSILERLQNKAAATANAGGADSVTGRHAMWVSYAHTEQNTKGDRNTAKRKHRIDGLTVGGDTTFDNGWSIGAALSYAHSKVKLDARRSSSDVDSYGLGFYASKAWQREAGSLNFVAGLGHIWHDIDTRRAVDLGGAQTLKASYDARTLQAFGELGYALAVNQQSTIEPYVNLTWLQHRTKGFNESGGAAALRGEKGTENLAFSTLGVRAGTTFEAGERQIHAYAALGWRHAFGDREPKTGLSFIEGGGQRFSITGAPIAKNTAVFALGAELQLGRNASLGLGYEGQAGNRYTEHAGNLYLKLRF